MNSSEFEIRFRELQDRFLQRMAVDRKKMNHMLTDLREGRDYNDSLRLFSMLVHQYSGNGRTFGFPRVSEAAFRLEAMMQSISGPEALAASFPEIDILAQGLMNSCEHALSEGATPVPAGNTIPNNT